jgi:4-hydroxybenzoate polyprenyltransferase
LGKARGFGTVTRRVIGAIIIAIITLILIVSIMVFLVQTMAPILVRVIIIVIIIDAGILIYATLKVEEKKHDNNGLLLN